MCASSQPTELSCKRICAGVRRGALLKRPRHRDVANGLVALSVASCRHPYRRAPFLAEAEMRETGEVPRGNADDLRDPAVRCARLRAGCARWTRRQAPAPAAASQPAKRLRSMSLGLDRCCSRGVGRNGASPKRSNCTPAGSARQTCSATSCRRHRRCSCAGPVVGLTGQIAAL